MIFIPWIRTNHLNEAANVYSDSLILNVKQMGIEILKF